MFTERLSPTSYFCVHQRNLYVTNVIELYFIGWNALKRLCILDMICFVNALLNFLRFCSYHHQRYGCWVFSSTGCRTKETSKLYLQTHQRHTIFMALLCYWSYTHLKMSCIKYLRHVFFPLQWRKPTLVTFIFSPLCLKCLYVILNRGWFLHSSHQYMKVWGIVFSVSTHREPIPPWMYFLVEGLG